MAGTILLCWLMNNLFLEKYYIRSKTEVIYEAYETIRQAANSDTYNTEDFHKELNNVCNIYNITVYVMDANSRLKYASINGGEELEKRLAAYVFGLFSDSAKVIAEDDGCVVQQVHTDGGDFLEMYGRLSSGISFIMHTPLESIRESVKIANRFLAYMGIVATVAGGIIIWFVSTKITKPILELNRISEKMVHLDFEARYEGSDGNEIGLLGENINKLSASLEHSISDLKTANNELLKDIKKKEEIDAMRREFLANVSHELKTPIALIQGYAEGLSEGVNDDPESRSFYCEVIMDEAAKMNNMVKKLMTLSQLESGNDTVTMERFDVTALIRNYIQSAGILTKQNEITVRMEDYGSVYVWGDVYKTEEVFMNYFSNAVNHCQTMDIRKGKIIVISLEQREGNIRIGVFNTGKPIPEEAVPHLWEKFYKVDKARTREYGGSGVGLSIVKAIMESVNQKFGVENYSNGVLFWFELESALSDRRE
ncbi:MAG: HAMP domain-containing protein [Lachnospiraceae bacterium]|nr:histidine kinase dimerization/phospho-acceptor domain-containing protein [uncultured Acetatifactor sp.]MCI9221426.1 HAMP domain-containing protein [Lachnospiraceae bacterium]